MRLFTIKKLQRNPKGVQNERINGVLGHDSGLLRLYWAGDNLEPREFRKSPFDSIGEERLEIEDILNSIQHPNRPHYMSTDLA